MDGSLENWAFVAQDVGDIRHGMVFIIRKEDNIRVSVPLLCQCCTKQVEIFKHGRNSKKEGISVPARRRTPASPLAEA